MLNTILGARLSWHFANGWVFEPAIVGPDIVDYTLKEGPHAGRHAIQHFYLPSLPAWNDQSTLKWPSSLRICRGQSCFVEVSFLIFSRNAGSWLSPRYTVISSASQAGRAAKRCVVCVSKYHVIWTSAPLSSYQTVVWTPGATRWKSISNCCDYIFHRQSKRTSCC